MEVKNPDDASHVSSGAKVIGSWDNEIEGDKQSEFERHGITSGTSPDLKRALVVDFGEKEELKFDLKSNPLYLCRSCLSSIEASAYSELSKSFQFVNLEIQKFLSPYLKGHVSTPSGIIVSQGFECKCGEKIFAKFYKRFVERELPVRDSSEFLLIGAVNSVIDIDGVYSRDECFGLLEKLLIRWGAAHNLVMLVVPFIGFDYKGTEKKRIDLWNRVLKHTIPDKTAIVTRKSTFTSFKEAASNQCLDIAFLKDYDLLNPTLAEMTEKDALFKRDFHAKFYCGFSGTNVEVLHGSFNIHGGSYVENIQFKEYKFPDFLSRYMTKLGVHINPSLLVQPSEVLSITINSSGGSGCGMVACKVSLAEVLEVL